MDNHGNNNVVSGDNGNTGGVGGNNTSGGVGNNNNKVGAVGHHHGQHGHHNASAGSGNPLGRTLTPGGHPVDSTQPGFPVFNRKIANPSVLGTFGVAASLFILGLTQIGVQGILSIQIWIAVGLPYGGLGCILASMWEFALGNTVGATIFGSISGVIIAFSLITIPFFNVQQAYLGAAATAGAAEGLTNTATLQALGASQIYQAAGLFLFSSFIVFVILVISSQRTTWTIAGGLTSTCVALVLYASFLVGSSQNHKLSVASGAFNLLTAALAFYTGTAVLCAEEGLRILPLMQLPQAA